MPLVYRERDQEDEEPEPASKRPKLDALGEWNHVLPPSHSLLGIPLPVATDGPMNFVEADVGISEYIGHGIPKIEGIIKQRLLSLRVLRVYVYSIVGSGSQTS
jgi:tRNA pseudouridine13 synthase